MKKETVLKFLAYSCFLLPGSPKPKKIWYLSPLSLLSLLALIFVIMATISEFVGHTKFISDKNLKDALMKLKHVPIRHIGYCLRPLGTNETLIEVEGEKGISVVDIKTAALSKQQNNGSLSGSNVTSMTSPTKHPMSDLEDIVNTAYRLLVFVTNILIRIFLWFSFTTLVGLLTNVFLGEVKKQSEGNRSKGFMCLLWYESAQRWSTDEKVFLVFILLSQLQREVDFAVRYYTSIANTGINLLVIPCVVFQVAIEQSKVYLGREFAMEVVAFFLVVVMKTFVNVISSIAGGMEEKSSNDPDEQTTEGQNGGLVLEELKTRKQFGVSLDNPRKAASDVLFVNTRAMLMKGDAIDSRVRGGNRGIETIDEQISGILGGRDSTFTEEAFRTTNSRKRPGMDAFYGGGGGNGSLSAADVIYSEIDFVIGMYFDLMGIWEQTSKFTGFVTLLLFCELTTTFCFNTYITLDRTVTYGLLSEHGATGIMRGIAIVCKLVCVCNAAQELRDMTSVLLERILKLKLQLLSLPMEDMEVHKKYSKVKGDLPSIILESNHMTSQCTRCRGLGSLLSEMVSYIRGHPFELSALGYFSVSRSTLTTITGVIVTYLVVLVQFQSYASSSK